MFGVDTRTGSKLIIEGCGESESQWPVCLFGCFKRIAVSVLVHLTDIILIIVIIIVTRYNSKLIDGN